MTLGSVLQEALREQGVTQRQVASECGVSEARVSAWLCGDKIPHKHLVTVAQMAKLKIAELVPYMTDRQVLSATSILIADPELVKWIRILSRMTKRDQRAALKAARDRLAGKG